MNLYQVTYLPLCLFCQVYFHDRTDFFFHLSILSFKVFGKKLFSIYHLSFQHGLKFETHFYLFNMVEAQSIISPTWTLHS